uniref:Thyroid transcription factor 1-associated protein 26 n=1 Tax=Electrophorus electricus TaxID=8005 RepID=A0A4W4HP28_ELEEL
MAPANPRFSAKASFKDKKVKNDCEKGPSLAVTQKKKKMDSREQVFRWQFTGFAFKRRQQIKQEYRKLLRKEKWRMQDSKAQLTEEYPAHLKHLYLAEQQRLDEEEQMKRIHRRKGRTVEPEEEEIGTVEPLLPVVKLFHKDTPRQKNQKKMSSYQKMKQEYEKIKEEQDRKRQEYLKDKAQREEALKNYKEKKMATYQLLKKKTKKGQPNLNLQMELLLQKIQDQHK